MSSRQEANTHAVAFHKLPVELNLLIATYLPTRRDVRAFELSCRSVLLAINFSGYAAWAALGKREFDMSSKWTNTQIYYRYRRRVVNLRKKTFKKGHGESEKVRLSELQQIVNESFVDAEPGDQDYVSNNMIFLRKFVSESNLISRITSCLGSSDTYHNLLLTLQVCFTYWMLDLQLKGSSYGFQYSQKAVYGHPMDRSLFTGVHGGIVKKDQILHIINFFRYHIKSVDENTLHPLFSALDENERPQGWTRILGATHGIRPLGRNWKGSYTYLPRAAEVAELRQLDFNRQGKDGVFADELDIQDGLEEINFDFAEFSNNSDWPKVYEQLLHAMPSHQLCRHRELYLTKGRKWRMRDSQPSVVRVVNRNAQQTDSPPITPDTTAPRGIDNDRLGLAGRQDIADEDMPETPTSPVISHPRKHWDYLPFIGTLAHGSDEFSLRGILHNLPDQEGISDWHRISFMKYIQEDAEPVNIYPNSVAGSSTPSPTNTGGFNPVNASTPLVQALPPVSDDPVIDQDTWAYEGVVLPGGKIIVGRYWSPLEQLEEDENEDVVRDDEDRANSMCNTGPFLMWCVGDD